MDRWALITFYGLKMKTRANGIIHQVSGKTKGLSTLDYMMVAKGRIWD